MMSLKKWLFERFYPAVAKEEIARLRLEIAAKDAEIDRLNYYIDGMRDGQRAQRRIVINNNGVTK